MPRVKIKKSEDNPETPEILAEAITRIGEAFAKLQESGLNRKAIVILIQAETKLNRTEINQVLNALAQLRGWYCRD